MRILLLGKNGQVGWELLQTLAGSGEITALGRDDLDLSIPDQIRRRVQEIKPDLIVNGAAYTAVDKAEQEPELAMSINGIAPGILAEEAKKIGAALIHYSTDYVFNGNKKSPYTEDDAPSPVSVYGKTKLAGDMAIQAVGVPHLIFRTGWVYGLRGKNFLLTMQRLAREGKDIRVVDDQIGAPTWCRVIAESTAQIISQLFQGAPEQGTARIKEYSGIYNMTCSGQTSWHGFAKAILDRGGLSSSSLTAIPTTEYPTPAARPRYSVLSKARREKIFQSLSPAWEDSLKICLGGTALD